MLKISYAECFQHNSLLKCVSQRKSRKVTENAYFGHSRSLMLVPLESLSAVLVLISSKSAYLQPFSC